MSETAGERIRNLRQRQGLSQAELTEGIPIAASYISLIERGLRRPSHQVLTVLASRLGCTAEYLESGLRGPGTAELEVELRFADLALRSGDPISAKDRFDRVLSEATGLGLQDIAQDARWGLARASEALGDLENAIGELEWLARQAALKGSFRRAAIAVRLAHVYLDMGEPVRAAEVVESALETRGDETLRPDESVELLTSLVACLYEKGELTRAHLLARKVIEDAEENASPRSRAAAYWEAGLVAERRGDLRNARVWTERALALYGESDNVRAAASLRFNCAWVILRCPEADLAHAKALLRQAVTDLSECGTQLDVAKAETELARCLLLEGDAEASRATVTIALDRVSQRHHMEEASARVILARALATSGDLDAAIQSYRAAFTSLEQIDGGRDTAVAWRELADDLLAVGLMREGIDAYKRSADAAGVRTAPRFTDSRPAVATVHQG